VVPGHHVPRDRVDLDQQRVLKLLRQQRSIDPGEHLARVDQPSGQQLRRDPDRPLRVARHDTLPAKESARDPDELQRPEHHLDGNPFGDIAQRGRHKGHRQQHHPVRHAAHRSGPDSRQPVRLDLREATVTASTLIVSPRLLKVGRLRN
jgi:hypothetical protein